MGPILPLVQQPPGPHVGLHCTVQYCVILYCIVLYCPVLYCIVFDCIVVLQTDAECDEWGAAGHTG